MLCAPSVNDAAVASMSDQRPRGHPVLVDLLDPRTLFFGGLHDSREGHSPRREQSRGMPDAVSADSKDPDGKLQASDSGFP